jgi:4-hydroxy-tetrahydrodipicolinate synthase
VGGGVEEADGGDWELARELYERAAPSFAFENSEEYPNPMPSKAALRVLGINVGECRPPHGPSEIELDLVAAEVVSSLKSSRG